MYLAVVPDGVTTWNRLTVKVGAGLLPAAGEMGFSDYRAFNAQPWSSARPFLRAGPAD